jgi:glycosyltransferase involved in cell wall biosynthesis
MKMILLTRGTSWSGVEVHTIHLASALIKRGHDVVIVELNRRLYADAHQSVPCPVLNLDIGQRPVGEVPLDSLRFRSWLRILGSLQADVAISVKGDFKFGSLSMEAAARLRFPRFLVIEHMHAPLSKRIKGQHLKGLVSGIGLWWYRQKFSGYLRSVFPHRVICVSHALASTLRKDYGFPPWKLSVVHSGVDTDRFTPSPLLRNRARETWGITEKAFVFGTIGRLSPMKNHGQLISAFSKLCEEKGGRDIRLVIVGDGPLRSSLEALAHSSRVHESIFFGGFSRFPEKIYPAFDVFCLPSIGEALGLSLLEAMSCGCPAIAAEVGGVPEILNNSRLGWLIPSEDESALLSAMRLSIELGSDRLRQIGVNSREHVSRWFNAIDCWDELAKVIETVV